MSSIVLLFDHSVLIGFVAVFIFGWNLLDQPDQTDISLFSVNKNTRYTSTNGENCILLQNIILINGWREHC